MKENKLVDIKNGWNIPRNQHQILIASKKRCFICGAEYPVANNRKSCACSSGGYLYMIMQ